MKRALVLLALVLFVSPGATAATAKPIQPEFPDDLKALGPQWVADVGDRIAPYADRPWYAEMDGFYQKAKREADEGRLRAAMFDLETVVELLEANLLVDAAPQRSEAERKAIVLERTQSMHRDGEAAWSDFRARAKDVQSDIASLHALEMTLYAADIALTAKLNLNNYVHLVPEFRKANFSREATLDMLRASRTPSTALDFANDILDVAMAREGLPPRLEAVRWQERYVVPELSRTSDDSGRLSAWEDVAKEVRPAGEGVMAVAIGLAEQRALRQQQISLTYGDAGSRGLDVLHDAVRFMERRLNRTSYEDVRPHGLLGVFTADAVDQARFVLEFAAAGKAQLPFVTATWATLDHQEFAALVLADVSPVEPEKETNLGFQNDLTRYTVKEEKQTPGAPVLLAAAVAALAALGLRRRRRG